MEWSSDSPLNLTVLGKVVRNRKMTHVARAVGMYAYWQQAKDLVLPYAPEL